MGKGTSGGASKGGGAAKQPASSSALTPGLPEAERAKILENHDAKLSRLEDVAQRRADRAPNDSAKRAKALADLMRLRARKETEVGIPVAQLKWGSTAGYAQRGAAITYNMRARHYDRLARIRERFPNKADPRRAAHESTAKAQLQRNLGRFATAYGRFARVASERHRVAYAARQASPAARATRTRPQDWAAIGAKGPLSKKEATAAYRTAMRAAHPDKGGSPEKAKRINAAWDRLKGTMDW